MKKRNLKPNLKKRSYLLPPGCKDLIDVLNSPNVQCLTEVRINEQIRAATVRVFGEDAQSLGIMQLADALSLSRSQGLDLVEIAPNATPPVCRIIKWANGPKSA